MTTDTRVDVEYFPPTRPNGETRAETLARVIRDDHLDQGLEPLDADPTTATGGNRRIAIRTGAAAMIGAVIGALGGLLLSLAPGAFAVDSTGQTIGYMVVLGGAVAVVVAIVATLLQLEQEDGRFERQVAKSNLTQGGPRG